MLPFLVRASKPGASRSPHFLLKQGVKGRMGNNTAGSRQAVRFAYTQPSRTPRQTMWNPKAILAVGCVYATATFASALDLLNCFLPMDKLAHLTEEELKPHRYLFDRVASPVVVAIVTSVVAFGAKFEPARVSQTWSQHIPRFPTRGGALFGCVAGFVASIAMDHFARNDSLKTWLGFAPHHNDDMDRNDEAWFHLTALERSNHYYYQRRAFLRERWVYLVENVVVLPVLGAVFDQRMVFTTLVAYTNPVAAVGLSGLYHFVFVFGLEESDRKEGQMLHLPVADMLSGMVLCIAYLATGRLAVPFVIGGLYSAWNIGMNIPSALPITILASPSVVSGIYKGP